MSNKDNIGFIFQTVYVDDFLKKIFTNCNTKLNKCNKISQIHVYKPKKTRCLINYFANCVSSIRSVFVYLTLIFTLIHEPSDFSAV